MLVPDPSRELSDLARLTSTDVSARNDEWHRDLCILLSTGRLIPTKGEVLFPERSAGPCLVVDRMIAQRTFLVEQGPSLVRKGLGIAVRMRDGGLSLALSCGGIVDYLTLGATKFQFETVKKGTIQADGTLLVSEKPRWEYLPITSYFIPPPALHHIVEFLTKECSIADPKLAMILDSTTIPSLSLSVHIPVSIALDRSFIANRIGFYLRNSISLVIDPRSDNHYPISRTNG